MYEKKMSWQFKRVEKAVIRAMCNANMIKKNNCELMAVLGLEKTATKTEANGIGMFCSKIEIIGKEKR